MLNRFEFGKFRCVSKVENVLDRHRSTGRLFQARGLATARARSPMVERRVAGTRTSAVDAELLQCLMDCSECPLWYTKRSTVLHHLTSLTCYNLSHLFTANIHRETAVPAEGNGNLQTLICVLVARPRRCLTLSNPVP